MPFQFQIVQYSWEVSNCCFRVPEGGREKEQQEKKTPGRQYLLLARLVTNDSLCLLSTLKQGESQRSVNTQTWLKEELCQLSIEGKKSDFKEAPSRQVWGWQQPWELFHGNLAPWADFQTTCGVETESLEAEPQPSHFTSDLRRECSQDKNLWGNAGKGRWQGKMIKQGYDSTEI